jgi:sporulation protein YlmC with PRC-barrel domain
MEPRKYDNPEQSLTTPLGSTLGAAAIPLDTPASDDARRAVRVPVPGEEPYVGRSGPGPKIMAADTLEADDLVNTAGDKLGELEHIMIDVPAGRVAYAVLSFGGFLGMGDKLFAIPWRALQIDPPNHRFILDVDKETLESAPGFDKDHWPSMADEQWAREIHTHYKANPYWD